MATYSNVSVSYNGTFPSEFEVLEPFKLFNKLNNFQPMCLIDNRTEENFRKKRIESSIQISSPEMAIEAIRSYIYGEERISRKIVGVKTIALLLSSETTSHFISHFQNLLQDFTTKNNAELVMSVFDSDVHDPNKIDVKAQFTFTLDDNSIVADSSPHQNTNLSVTDPIDDNSSVESGKNFKMKIYILQNIENFLELYDSFSFVSTGDIERKWNNKQYYPSEILPKFLYLGDFFNATNMNQLKQIGITHIVDATGNRESESTAASLGLQYHPVDIDDVETANLMDHFPQTTELIENAWLKFSSIGDSSIDDEGSTVPRVLVHCRAGWSRSPSIVLAFLMKCFHWSLIDASRLVVRERPMVCPNRGFMAQLMTLEASLFKESSSHHELCPNIQALRIAINEESCLWTTSLTVETNFDRVPINAFKNQAHYLQALEGSSEPENVIALDENAPKKPKKPFLKRGEGKKAARKPTLIKNDDNMLNVGE